MGVGGGKATEMDKFVHFVLESRAKRKTDETINPTPPPPPHFFLSLFPSWSPRSPDDINPPLKKHRKRRWL